MGNFDPQGFPVLLCHFLVLFPADKAKLGQLVGSGQAGIELDRVKQDHTLLLPILGNQTNAVLNGGSWRSNMHLLTVHPYFAGVHFLCTADQFHGLAATGTNQTGKAQNFTTMEPEADILHGVTGEILSFQNDLTHGSLSCGEVFVQLTANHQVDQLLTVCVSGVDGGHILAVTKNRDPLGNLEHLVHTVGNVDHCHAFGFQLCDDGEQQIDLGCCQRSGGFIHDHDFCVIRNGAGNLHHLLIGRA